ncbi:unnamed protein product, partial [Wuchereria bancrofti]
MEVEWSGPIQTDKGGKGGGIVEEEQRGRFKEYGGKEEETPS